jgi:hypothetical protein
MFDIAVVGNIVILADVMQALAEEVVAFGEQGGLGHAKRGGQRLFLGVGRHPHRGGNRTPAPAMGAGNAGKGLATQLQLGFNPDVSFSGVREGREGGHVGVSTPWVILNLTMNMRMSVPQKNVFVNTEKSAPLSGARFAAKNLG